MIATKRGCARAGVAACLLVMLTSMAGAAGAFAVGACGAYGYGFDYYRAADARVAALKKCSGARCKIVGVFRLGCASMAVDAKNPCGPYGWAINPHLGKAENMSLRRCNEFGGHACVVRAWACDEKG